MSKYDNSGRSSDKKYSYSSSKPKSGGKPSSGRSFGSGKPNAGKSSGSGRGGSRSARPVKKFNPSMFIKKVEEQVVSEAYVPKHKFSDFAMADKLKENIEAKGYELPTPIQDQAIPYLLEGRDVIASANTGTGKTAAFLIPLIHRVLTKQIERVLIITPTRELAAQIQDELNSFKRNMPLSSTLCIGGVNINFQIQHLRKDPAFVIGTPGRLLDLEQNRHLNLQKYSAIVLDEVDTMLDMGFIKDIKYIIGKLPKQRQSLFFSATMPDTLKPLMDSFLHNPISISVKTRQSAENVNQDVVRVNDQNKIEILHDLLIKPEFTRVIIFSRTKHATDKLSRVLRERGFQVATIHGNKSQGQRKTALELFKALDNKVNILLATDVVARGIDIDDVSHVINFDMPQSYEDYIHRIGRTGRANKVGQALTFVD